MNQNQIGKYNLEANEGQRGGKGGRKPTKGSKRLANVVEETLSLLPHYFSSQTKEKVKAFRVLTH